MKEKRILITRTDRLGDVVLSTPVIRLMRRKYPNAYIAFMVRPENQDVIINNPHLDEVIVYDKREMDKSFRNTLRFSLGLRKKKFDTAIALHPTNRVHIMFFLAGIPVRIGYDRKVPFLLTKRILHDKHEGAKHEIDYIFDFLQQAGFDVREADRMPYMAPSHQDKESVGQILKEVGIKGDIIALHAGASCASKRWPCERFARVADILAEKYKACIALVGARDTLEYSDLVVSKSRGKIIDLTGRLKVGELAEFLSRCKLFVSNDSGPVHVASAVGTPVVVIFGRRDPGLSPKRWEPLGRKNTVIHKDAGCDVCLAHDCEKDFMCLKMVTVDDVVEAAEKLLTRQI
ncbi:MAG: lipopolysaccharide heptosyltransferase II [Candidatus Omnitrophota bacterium]